MPIEFYFTPNHRNGRKALHASCLVRAAFIMATCKLLKEHRVPLPDDIPPRSNKGTANLKEKLFYFAHVGRFFKQRHYPGMRVVAMRGGG